MKEKIANPRLLRQYTNDYSLVDFTAGNWEARVLEQVPYKAEIWRMVEAPYWNVLTNQTRVLCTVWWFTVT
jgi:hypothetical protein